MKNEVFRQDIYNKLEEINRLIMALGQMTENNINYVVKRLDNHLKHHEECEKRRSDRWFKLLTILFQVALGWLILKKT